MRIVGKSGNASIVQFEDEDGVLRRCLLPKSVIRKHGNSIPVNILNMGVEIGCEVEEAFSQLDMPTPDDLLSYTRSVGLWTREDILGNIPRFKQVLVEAFGSQIIHILREMR